MNSQVILEKVDCPICGSKGCQDILKGSDRLHNLPGEYTVVRCQSCGLMRTNPRPTSSTIGVYYPEDYGPYLGTQVRIEDKKRSKPRLFLRRMVEKVFQFNTEVLPQLKPGVMLEVGCASGAFLHRMAAQGWQVKGVEFSEKASQAARDNGYEVYTGALETAPLRNQQFDLIVGWMVLEHLHDPVKSLTKLRESAKPDTYLVLSVPNAASIEFRLFKQRWYSLHLPNHLYHFTPKTITMMLETSGWKLEKIYHQRVLSDVIASLGYWLLDKGYGKMGHKLVNFPENPGRAHLFLFPLAWFLSLFGQTGRMTIWAKIRK